MDYSLFEFLNGTLHHPFLDPVMKFLTDSERVMYGTIGAMVLYLLYQKGNRKAVICVVGALITFAIADSAAYRFLKPYFGRVRPANESYFLDGINVFLTEARFIIGMNNGFSTPSNHAANMFSQATFWTLLYPKWGKILIPVAALITYTRVYVGVHYPFDLLLGAILGIASGMLVWLLFRKLPISLPA